MRIPEAGSSPCSAGLGLAAGDPDRGREAWKTQPEASPAESAETKEALEAKEAKEAPAEAEAPDAAVAAAGRMARALGLDRLMDPARCAAAARAAARWRRRAGTRHASADAGGRVASETERASFPAGLSRNDETTTTHTFFERDLELATLCEHHLLPFHGAVHVAYAADARTKPLSRAAAQRAVARRGHRFQVQERLTRDIARDVAALTGAPGVMVAVRASHLCMIARGWRSPARQRSAAALGAFAEDAERRARFWETLAER